MKTAIGYYRKINTEWNKNVDQKVNDKKEKIRIRTEKEKTRKPCALWLLASARWVPEAATFAIPRTPDKPGSSVHKDRGATAIMRNEAPV